MTKFFFSFLAIYVLILNPATVYAKQEMLVFAAASLTNALNDIEKIYQDQAIVDIQFNWGGSRALAQQIIHGMPCDMFVAADRQSVETLVQRGLVEERSQVYLLENQLVVVKKLIPGEEKEKFDSLYDFKLGLHEFLAIADPKTAPAGVYAWQTLERTGVLTNLEQHLVPAMDVRAALGLVKSGNAKYAIVYQSDVLNLENIQIVYRIPSALHDRIVYAVVPLKNSPHKAYVNAFISFLQSQQAMRIFKNYGFVPYEL